MHVNGLLQNLEHRLSVLNRIYHILDEKSLTAYFNGLVIPRLDYADIEVSLVWQHRWKSCSHSKVALSMWLKNMAMFCDKFYPFVRYNWIVRKLMHSFARSVARWFVQLWLLGVPATQYLPPHHTFSLEAVLQSCGLVHNTTSQATWPDIWPPDSKTAFESKIAKLSGVIKSPLLFKDGSNFELGSLKCWMFKILKHWFRFIYTLRFR